MRTSFLVTALLLLTVNNEAALAQSATSDNGGGDAAPGTRKATAVASSFESLPQVLRAGQEVIVSEASGRKTRGRVVSVTDAKVVVASPLRGRWRTRVEERVFTEDVVTRIEVRDSAWWPGGLIGLVASAPVLAWSISGPRPRLGGPLSLPLVGLPAILGGTALGGLIDWTINAPVYQRQPRAPRVTISPTIGTGQTGVVARVSF